jgi:hypothetical protein
MRHYISQSELLWCVCVVFTANSTPLATDLYLSTVAEIKSQRTELRMQSDAVCSVYHMMDILRTHSNHRCHTPPSEPFRAV